MKMDKDISELYNFNYNCVYHIDNIKNNSKYDYDLSQIISNPADYDNIFFILNENKYTKYMFNLLRQKMPEEFSNETNDLHNIILFYKILSYEFLYVYHPCICDIYNENEIKSENLNCLLEKLDSYTI